VLLKWTLPAYPVAVFPYASWAVTVILPAFPAVVGEGKPDTTSVLAGPGLTVIGALVFGVLVWRQH
jgi:hypothetical protein